VLIAALALVWLWCLSPSVTAGDELPKRVKGEKPEVCPDDPLPLPRLPSAARPEKNPSTVDVPSLNPLGSPPAKPDLVPPPVPTGAAATNSIPPIPPISAKDTSPPPDPPIVPASAVTPARVAPPTTPPVEGQEIKQFMAQLTEIRAERAKLEEKERQTILTIRRKYQEQKQALELIARELQQLGIDCEETTTKASPRPLPPPDEPPQPSFPPPGKRK